VLNFEESKYPDIARYEALPVVMLKVKVFWDVVLCYLASSCDILKDHCAFENQELLAQLHSATSVKT
jgi:hypothetical protein